MTSIFAARVTLFIVALFGVSLGIVLGAAGPERWQAAAWIASSVIVLAALLVQIVNSLWRGDFGLDVLAFVSMSAALGVKEFLAAAVVALMYAGGQLLEAFAERSARREMSALLSRVPRSALKVIDGGTEETAVDALRANDHILVRQGETVPTDGLVTDGVAVLDESGLTGEAVPVRYKMGDDIMSGACNVGDAFTMTASRPADESTFASIVRLVEAAQQSKPAISRFADRFAMWLILPTACIAGAAWTISEDITRTVAVLVVATPCPLILGVPIAFMAGLSRAARHGILLKGGGVIEALGRVDRMVLDKTGTLTEGRARLVDIDAIGMPPEEVLRLAASLDQASKHVVAKTIVDEAHRRGLRLDLPANVVESPGEGIVGTVGTTQVVVGGPYFVARHLQTDVRPEPGSGLIVSVAANGQPAGWIRLADKVRDGTAGLINALRQRGVRRIVLATGDRQDIAAAIAEGLDIDQVYADLSPAHKTDLVRTEALRGAVMMVGDGVNDAPALAMADVGVAMGAKGSAAASEAAGVVLLVDRLDRIVMVLDIAARSRRIALQCAAIGTSLSFAGMVAAALGYLTPVQGAFLQEAIDIAAISNALRALRDPTDSLGTASATGTVASGVEASER